MIEAHPYEYEAVSIPSFESLAKQSTSSHASQDEIQITHDMVLRLCCEEEGAEGVHPNSLLRNAPTPPVSEAGDLEAFQSMDTINYETPGENLFSPQLMIIYEAGDIDCAMYFVMESLHEPFFSNAVATVLVEERIRDNFVKRVLACMRPLSSKVSKNRNYLNSLERLNQLDAEVIQMDMSQFASSKSSPIMVCNCVHSMLGKGQTGVLCLHTFRSTLEAVDICRRDRTSFASVCIWNECIEGIYQLAASLSCLTFYFNCNNVSLEPISASVAAQTAATCVADNYHYETLKIYDKQKIIIFPFGAHLVQREDTRKERVILPISYLDE